MPRTPRNRSAVRRGNTDTTEVFSTLDGPPAEEVRDRPSPVTHVFHYEAQPLDAAGPTGNPHAAFEFRGQKCELVLSVRDSLFITVRSRRGTNAVRIISLPQRPRGFLLAFYRNPIASRFAHGFKLANREGDSVMLEVKTLP